jgi:hypothetical protein
MMCMYVCSPDPLAAFMSTTNDEIVHCDCLLLKGSAVVNEASLTGALHTYIYIWLSLNLTLWNCSGESVPQMKEALSYRSASSGTGTDYT